MQEQIREAMTLGMKAAGGSAAPSPNAGRQPGGRILAAMFKANAGGCACEPCRLLRQEVQSLFDSFLQAGEEAAEEGPPAEPVPAVTGQVEAPASG